MDLIFYLLTGVLAGTFAGLLGIGGGIIVVPILDALFSSHFSSELSMHLAVGSSLAIMIFTSLSSAYAYHKRDLILWTLFSRFTPGLLLGVISGSLIAMKLSSNHLRAAFAVFMLIVAAYIFFAKPATGKASLPNFLLLSTVGFLTGILSGFFGVGGGMMMVPFFVFCQVGIHKATGTSALCGVPLSIVGTISLIVTGYVTLQSSLPSGATGYVYWPAVITVAITSILFAPLGTWLSVRLPTEILKKMFAIILVLTSVKLF